MLSRSEASLVQETGDASLRLSMTKLRGLWHSIVDNSHQIYRVRLLRHRVTLSSCLLVKLPPPAAAQRAARRPALRLGAAWPGCARSAQVAGCRAARSGS